jgi:hypothetical protein
MGEPVPELTGAKGAGADEVDLKFCPVGYTRTKLQLPATKTELACPVFSIRSPVKTRYFHFKHGSPQECDYNSLERAPEPDDLLPLRERGATWLGRDIHWQRGSRGNGMYKLDPAFKTEVGEHPIFSRKSGPKSHEELFFLDDRGNLKKLESHQKVKFIQDGGDVIVAARARLGWPPVIWNENTQRYVSAPSDVPVVQRTAAYPDPQYDYPGQSAVTFRPGRMDPPPLPQASYTEDPPLTGYGSESASSYVPEIGGSAGSLHSPTERWWQVGNSYFYNSGVDPHVTEYRHVGQVRLNTNTPVYSRIEPSPTDPNGSINFDESFAMGGNMIHPQPEWITSRELGQASRERWPPAFDMPGVASTLAEVGSLATASAGPSREASGARQRVTRPSYDDTHRLNKHMPPSSPERHASDRGRKGGKGRESRRGRKGWKGWNI